MKTSQVESNLSVPATKIPAPRAAAISLLLIFAAMLAWLIFSLLYSDSFGDIPLSLRRIDALWGWVALALFQLLLTPEQESKALFRATFAAIGLGILVCIYRQSIEPAADDYRRWIPLTEAIMISLAVLGSSLRGIAHLSGRAVKAADVWMFIAMQWLLVWAAADLVLTWRNAGELPAAMRQRLAEMTMLGAGVHVALGLALARLPVTSGAQKRDRASLVALAAYNIGLVALLLGLDWVGCTLMFVGVGFYMAASGMLLRGDQRLVPLLVLIACVFLMSATVMRPFDTGIFAGWKHAAAGGCVGIAAVIAAIFAGRDGVPAQHRANGVLIAGALLYVIGVAARLGVEMYETVEQGVHKSMLFGSILEILGVLLLCVAALRGRAIRRRLGL